MIFSQIVKDFKQNKNNRKMNFYYSLILGFISFLICFLSQNLGFYWDAIAQISQPAHYYYQQGLTSLALPSDIDLGLVPIIAYLTAAAWLLLGKSLFVSHLILFPFIWALLWQLFRFVSYFIESKSFVILVFLFLCADPSFNACLVLLNYDLIQFFLFFAALNAILYKKTKLVYLYTFFLSLISFRAMILSFSVISFDMISSFLLQENKGRRMKELFKKMSLYFLAFIPLILFHLWHFSLKGVIFGSSDQNLWLQTSRFVDISGFLRNILVLIHRNLDYGRIFIFLGLGLIFYRMKAETRRELFFQDAKFRLLLILYFLSLFFIGALSLVLKNPMGHRYFIANYLILALIFSYLIVCKLKINFNKKKFILCLFSLALLTGNLWIYPKKMAQGWDASLAHLPYHRLREQMISYMDSQQIPIEKTASFFPNIYPLEIIDLGGDSRSFISLDSSAEYVFYSNTYNVSTPDLLYLDANFNPIKRFEAHGVEVVLYKKKSEF